jgi:hypothetical protein
MNRALRIVPLAVLLVGCDSIGIGTVGPPLPVPPLRPTIEAPRYAAFTRGREDTLAFFAWDENGESFSISANLSALPRAESSVITMNPIVDNPGAFRCTLRWTAAASDMGIYRISFKGSNRLVGDPDTTIIYTVDHDVDLPPRVSCPESIGLVAGAVRTFSVTFEDPDGDPLLEVPTPVPLTNWRYDPLEVLSWTTIGTGSQVIGTVSVRAAKAPAEYFLVFLAINAMHGEGRTRLYVSGP